MVTGSSFVRRLFAALVACGLSSAALAQTEAPHPYLGPVDTTPVLISVQTANAAASMQWLSLGSTYNNYELVCNGVFPSTNGDAVYIQFGEGATPTWETSSYQWAGFFIVSITSTLNPDVNASDSGVKLTNPGNTLAASVSVRATIYNIPVAGVNKTVSFEAQDFTSDVTTLRYSGAYGGDTNVITAIRVVAGTSNITGTCALYGVR